MELPVTEYRNLPKGMTFDIVDFELEYFSGYVITPDFKCTLPKHLQHVFYITKDFWKNSKMIYQDDGELIFKEFSGKPKPIVEIRYLPRWIYFNVITFDRETITTPYFRVKLSKEHFDSNIKINFWKNRKDLKICYDLENKIHFYYSDIPEIPFLELEELPIKKSKYEIDTFSRDDWGNVYVHTKYFKCPAPWSSLSDFKTKSRVKYWNNMPGKLLSCEINEDGTLDITWYSRNMLTTKHFINYSALIH